MKKFKMATLLLAGLLAFTGCATNKEITAEEGAAWAEANGYVKYVDTFTTASIKNTGYAGCFEEGQALLDAMTAKKGVTTISTINPDGTVDVAYIRFALSYDETTSKWLITAGIGGTNEDGTLCQTAQNILREKKGTAYFMSHSYTEQVPTFAKVTGDTAPEFEEGKYYGYAKRTDYSLLKEAPEDWATNYGNYFTLVSTAPVMHTEPAESNTATSAKIYFNYLKHEENGYGGNNFILEVVSFERAS